MVISFSQNRVLTLSFAAACLLALFWSSSGHQPAASSSPGGPGWSPTTGPALVVEESPPPDPQDPKRRSTPLGVHEPSRQGAEGSPFPISSATSPGRITFTPDHVDRTGMRDVDGPLTNSEVATIIDRLAGWTPTASSRNPSFCGHQPNATPIEPYKGCPVPGLNNLLYTQSNRWYCAVRNGVVARLRDRICNKGSEDKYRYSTVVGIRYDALRVRGSGGAAHPAGKPEEGGLTEKEEPRGNGSGQKSTIGQPPRTDLVDRSARRIFTASTAKPDAAAGVGICWSDIARQDELSSCAWRDIPNFYGTDDWWDARQYFDFHEVYYDVADAMLKAAMVQVSLANRAPHQRGREPSVASLPHFVGVHLRRGDYWTHCHSVTKKRLPPWLTFFNPANEISPLGSMESCYPSADTMWRALRNVTARLGVTHVVVATNVPSEIEFLKQKGTASGVTVWLIPDLVLALAAAAPTDMIAQMAYKVYLAFRPVDRLALEVVIVSRATGLILNRYSSFSASAFEAAVIRRRVRLGSTPKGRSALWRKLPDTVTLW